MKRIGVLVGEDVPGLAVWLPLLVLLTLLALPSPGAAQIPWPDLSQASIEDLMKIEITSASRKEQRAADVAAAVFVITHDDIRRSGMSTIPDLLRLAPGVDVAQFNSNKWAVSVRGFNGLYANKLLVLIDGRTIYNRLFSGVFWDVEDLMLEDIERIEVIRGPGAAIWGGNSVNGVINIVTKVAADTKGGLVRLDVGRFGAQGAVRYGGTFGATRYRVYTQWTSRDESLIAPGTGADDASHRVATGFRADWTTRPSAFVLEGNLTATETRQLWLNLNPQTAARAPIAHDPSEAQGGHLLSRWTYTRRSGATLQIQSFVDIAGRQEPVGNYHRHAFDVDTQYHAVLGRRHDLVAGAGYRFIGEGLAGRVGFSLTPAAANLSLVTAFVQDEVGLFENRLALTIGSQIQYESQSGAGVQPTARVMWKALPRQRLWAAASRALRTPSLANRGLRLVYPPVTNVSALPLVVTVLGNPAAQTERLVDVEAGYRLEAGAASIDIVGYMGRYDHLVTRERAAPLVQPMPSPHILVTAQFANQLEATTRGVEVAGHWMPNPAWRLDASYTAFHVTPHLAAGSRDPAAAAEDGSAPRTQWQLRSLFSPGSRATLGVALFYVGPLERMRVDPYTRADISAEWRFTSALSATAVGQNLLDPAHAEFTDSPVPLVATQIPRGASVRMRWTF